MIRQLEAPKCHWSGCAWFGRPMKLLNEGDTFWFFHCECGCTRAVIKPSTRERSMHEKYQRDIDYIRRMQRAGESYTAYSLPSSKGVITNVE